MKAIIEEGSSDIAAHMQDLALSEGALPVHLLRALFTASNDTRVLPLKYLSQQLLALWSTGHPTTYGLLKRIFPLGLVAYLDSSEEPDKDFDEAALLGRDTLRVASEQHAQSNKPNALSTSIVNTANKLRNATQVKVLEQHVQNAFQHWSVKLKQNNKFLASSEHLSPGGSNSGNHANDKQQPVVLRKPRQRIRAEKNWRLFYQKFVCDHARPTLIWNNKTRDELRETIENEIRNFNIDKDLGHGHLISWNHNEFEVLYQCLNDEIKIGSVYLRLLLEQGELTVNVDAASGQSFPKLAENSICMLSFFAVARCVQSVGVLQRSLPSFPSLATDQCEAIVDEVDVSAGHDDRLRSSLRNDRPVQRHAARAAHDRSFDGQMRT